MENSQRSSDPRTALVGNLTHLREALRAQEELWRRKSAIAGNYQTLETLKKKWGVLSIVLWTIGFAIAAFTIASSVTNVIYGTILGPFFTEEWANANTGIAVTILIGLPIVLSAGLAVLVVFVRNRFVLHVQWSRAHRINQQRKTHNQTVWAEEQKVNGQLKQVGKDLSESIGNWYPQNYLYDEAVSYCAQAINNHRANTITDAIEVYEKELHRQRMENLQAWDLAEQQRTQKLVAVGNVMNAALTGAAIGTMRQEGKRTRASNAANAARVTEQLRKPVKVRKRR